MSMRINFGTKDSEPKPVKPTISNDNGLYSLGIFGDPIIDFNYHRGVLDLRFRHNGMCTLTDPLLADAVNIRVSNGLIYWQIREK